VVSDRVSWQAGRGPIGFLPAMLFRDRRPLVAILVGWLVSIAGSLAIGFVLSRIAAGPAVGPATELAHVSAPVILIGVALFSPLVETLIMAGIVDLLRRWLSAWQAVVANAALWGLAHSLLSPWWGAVIWWPFLIFSTIYVTWRPHGFRRAVGIVAVVHILQNTGPAVAMVLR
jgi:hypothetical protein